MKHKVSELEGALLDAAVAKAENLPIHPGPGQFLTAAPVDTRWAHEFGFSTDWADGGPIIERERITLMAESAGWFADARQCHRKEPHDEGSWCTQGRGPTPLIAAMRAFLAAKLGDVVQLP